MSEFELIQNCFAEQAAASLRSDVRLGIGDDCAILSPRPNHDLLVSVDTLVAGVHFPESISPYQIARRSLAVNLSDLAAMGGEPAWFTLALTVPEANESWLREFSRGLFDIANQFGINLVGGDTTRGPLSITIQVQGYAPAGQALRRDGAQVGDLVYVTGSLGDAGAGLALALLGNIDEADYLVSRFLSPTARIASGLALRDISSAAIDISDGLLADLGHILERSQVGAVLQADAIPLSPQLRQAVGDEQGFELALSAGDDYELCFCVPPEKSDKLASIAEQTGVPLCQIGVITAEKGVSVLDENGLSMSLPLTGYQHF
ncbi:MAG: thiamine-phosphate kinase [Pseudomonadales bacterium]